MFRSVPIRFHAALLALVAMLLLVAVPTLGRTSVATHGNQSAIEASRSHRDGRSIDHAHHQQRVSDAERAPAPMHAAADCVYCVLLGSIAQPDVHRARHAPPRSTHAPAGRVGAAPANPRPLSTLGSRGPPRVA